jgi:hypothetical protein
VGATVAANPSVLSRWMGSNQRHKLRLDDWIQTFKIRTLYRSIDEGVLARTTLLRMEQKCAFGRGLVGHV